MEAVLEKVAAIPMTEWNYIGYDERHIGPMAQDFHAAFGLGSTETTLNSLDLDGVALAAIQGLNQKLQETNRKLQDKEARIQALEEDVAELKQILLLLAP